MISIRYYIKYILSWVNLIIKLTWHQKNHTDMTATIQLLPRISLRPQPPRLVIWKIGNHAISDKIFYIFVNIQIKNNAWDTDEKY